MRSIHRRHPPTRRLRSSLATGGLSLLLGLVLSLPATPSAQARGRDAVNPLTRHVAGLTVAPARDFRLLTVHLLEAPMTARPPESARLAVTANPDTLGLDFPSRGRVRPTHLDNFAAERTVLVPGDVVRAREVDLVVTEHAVAPGGKRLKLPVGGLSLRDTSDAPQPEPALLRSVLPPTLRWAFTRKIREREARRLLADWADAAGLATPRRSPADLGSGTVIAERVDEYRQALGRTPRPGPGLRQVGYVALVDGVPVAIEVFGAPGDFAARWPDLLRGLAVEAAVLEVRSELLEAEMPPSGDPDRFLADVRALTLELHGDADRANASAEGRLYTVETTQGTMRGLVLDGEHVAHLLLLSDPRRRREVGEDGFDPDIVSGRRPQSLFEERFKDRLGPRPTPPGERPPTPVPRDDDTPIPR